MLSRLLLFVLLSAISLLVTRAADTIDPAFAPVLRGVGNVNAMEWNPTSGHLYVSVTGDKLNGQLLTSPIVRFTSDRTWDSAYAPSIDGTVSVIRVLPDGKIILAGAFTTVGGHSTHGLSRLLSDGAVDTTFTVSSGAVPTSIKSLAVATDGALYVGSSVSATATFPPQGITYTWPKLLQKVGATGAVDATFAPAFGYLVPTNGPFSISTELTITTLLATPGGGVIAGGNFNQVNGAARSWLVRLGASGATDASFNPELSSTTNFSPVSPSPGVVDIADAGQGRIYVGGAFSSVGGTTRSLIARLLVDGSLDTSFNVNLGGTTQSPLLPASINQLVVDSQDRVILNGSFTIVESTTRRYIARVNASGQLDPTFNASTGQSLVLKLLPNDDLFIGHNGAYALNGVVQPALSRVLAAGTKDNTFMPDLRTTRLADWIIARPGQGPVIGAFWINEINGVDVQGGIHALTVDGRIDPTFSRLSTTGSTNYGLRLPDGRLLLGGSFSTIGGTPRINLALIEADGSVAADIPPQPNSIVSLLRLLPSGQILVGGSFTSIDGVARRNVALLNRSFASNGPVTLSLDATFTPTNTETLFLDDAVQQADGKIVLAGSFAKFAGNAIPRLARLHPDGSVDTSFQPASQFSTFYPDVLGIDAAQRIYVGGFSIRLSGSSSDRSLYRLLPSGINDTSFNFPEFISSLYALHISPDNSIWCAGSFSGMGADQRTRIARLKSDGTVDPRFDAGTSANNTVSSFALQSPGRLWLQGYFTQVQGMKRDGVALLNLDNALPPLAQIMPPVSTTTEGANIRLDLHPLGTGETYAWFLNGSPLTGATGPSLTLNAATPLQAGTYTAHAINSTGQTHSTSILGVQEATLANWLTLQGLPSNSDAIDSDGDGQTNADEYVARTDPNDRASFFTTQIAPQSQNIRLTWPSYPGRLYTVEESEDLVTWETLGTAIPGTGSQQFIDVPSSPSGRLFWRVKVTK